MPYGQSGQGSALALSTPTPQQTPQRPTNLWEVYQNIRMLEGQTQQQETKLQAGVALVRHNTEAAALAAILGFVSGEIGLDIRGKYPADAIGAVLLGLLSIQQAGQPGGFSSDLRALSQTCNTVYFFRMAERWRSAKKTIETSAENMNIHTSAKPKEPPRSGPYDPILEAGRNAGL